MIQLQQVHKRYRTPPGPNRNAKVVEALRGVTLTVPAGASIGVVGPNGAGKSTLFGLILGFLRPSAGDITIEGVAPRDYTRTQGASYLPERFSLPPRWRVEDGLVALARLERIERPDQRAQAMLERFELAEHADKPVGALSRGLQQRLGLAQALLAPRSLVVLDEPTEGLDPIWRLRLRELLAELRAEGRTLLIASHELNEIERYIDEAIVLDNGVIQQTLPLRHDSAAPLRYRIQLREAVAGAASIFPEAEPDRVLLVSVADAADLSTRLAALLQQGAIVESVTPADSLEQLVHSALKGSA